jgi:alpha-maltose-1-phosphate synthase
VAESSTGRPSVLMGHPTGNQNSRNALRSLVEHEMLAEFWTTLAWNPERPWSRLLPAGLRAQLSRRTFSEAPEQQIKTAPWREMVRLGMRATPMAGILCSGERPFSIIGMYRHFDRQVAHRVAEVLPNIVYAYEGGALHTFREAKKRDITTIHEQPSSYWHWIRKLFAEEAERNPEFAGLLPTLSHPASHDEWKEEELRLADYVFVPSQHVLLTLAGVVPEEKIRVISYGAPPVRPRRQWNQDAGVPLKVLFAGALSQRKGIGYLLQAVDMLGSQVELTMIGRRLRPNARVDEACRRWRWHETLPHSKVLDVMQQADVLVLPSLAEGCALVVLEALACGLPVIITPNTGSQAYVREGREGFVVPIGCAETIAERLEILNRDRKMLEEMSRQAQVTAAANGWENYRANWIHAVRNVAWH